MLPVDGTVGSLITRCCFCEILDYCYLLDDLDHPSKEIKEWKKKNQSR